MALPKRQQFKNKAYEPLKQIGLGSHAVIWEAIKTKTGEHVAIKEVLLFDHQLTKRAYREVKLLQHFRGHPNIVEIHDLFTESGQNQFDSVLMVVELMSQDLDRLLRSNQYLSNDHIKLFLYQILCALKSIHSAGVIHRDVKPQNILINEKLTVKLCDFGTGRSDEDYSLSMTQLTEVATPYYRAPEGILNRENYSKSVDLWALGCVLAEMVTRSPLFPCKDNRELLKMILDVLGTPPPEVMDKFPDSKFKKYVLQLTGRRQALEDFLPSASPDVIDLLKHLLVFDPDKRISAEQALEHALLEPLHDIDDEPTWSIFVDKDRSMELCGTQCESDGEKKFHLLQWRGYLTEEIEEYEKKGMRNDVKGK